MQQWNMILEKQWRWVAAGILLLTLFAYSRAMTCGYIWDDDFYVTNNPVLTEDFSGLSDAWLKPGATPQYYPLVFTTFWVEHQIWGLWAGGYHFTNVLLHGLAAILLCQVLLKIGFSRWPAMLAAILFAIHPVHVESVAWITERKNVLSGVCYLAAAWCYLNFDDKRQARMWLGALVLFVFALLSKTVTSTLPAALLLYIWFKRGKITVKDFLPTLPFWIIGMGMGLMTLYMEKTHVGASGSEWELNALERVLLASRAITFYAGKLVWPSQLIFTYPKWQIDLSSWWQWTFPLGVMMFLGWEIARSIQLKHRGRTFALLFFCGTLFPALGFFDVFPFTYSYVADHFQYLASIGLIVLIAIALSRYPIIALSVVLVFTALTWNQVGSYKNARTLWDDTITKNPNAWMAHTNLGVIHITEGDEPAAITSFQKALSIKPNYAEALANMGAIAMLHKKYPEAQQWFQKALDSRANFYRAHLNMALVLTKLGEPQKALTHYSIALTIMEDPLVRQKLNQLQLQLDSQ
ncbi:MAG: glycosyltransferase family 39 protein [Phycisphaeraceae bacterium]|nr:glycosyltransferase family 39 protein [Phycisphaeraceae bacterium]